MTAAILQFTPSAGRFQSIEEVMAFNMARQQPAARLLDFFAWFGVDVDLSSSDESLVLGHEYLCSVVGEAIYNRLHHPDTFAFKFNPSPEQSEYLTAVIHGDRAGARAELPLTPYWPGLADAMATDHGSALLTVN